MNSSSLPEDFKPLSNDRSSIVRIVTCLQGEVLSIFGLEMHKRANGCSPRGERGKELLSDVSWIYFRLEILESEAAKG